MILPQFPPRYFNRHELDVLVALVASVSPQVVIEFGCNEGRAAATILRNVQGIVDYVGIDVLPGYVTNQRCQRKEVPAEPGKFAKADPRFRLIVRPRGAFDLWPGDLPAADAIFIDADHSREGVLNDTALAAAVIRPGGILIWHDDNGLPVVQVTQTLDQLYAAGALIAHVEGTWLAFQRV